MLLNIDWNLEFRNKGEKGKVLTLMEAIEVTKDINNLVDFATIFLPNAIMNDPIIFHNEIKRGTEVFIEMGYNGNLETEFVGFVRDIVNTSEALEIRCEDALFLFRQPIPDKELKPTTLSLIGQYIIKNIDPSYKLDCDYPIGYEKFTIHDASGYDVLSKLKEETSANIYFDTENKTLHIHPPYLEIGKKVYYSMQKNIESSSLEFKNKHDYKLEVTIETTDVNGNVKRVTSGSTGGDKFTLKVGSQDAESLKLTADAEIFKRTAPRYEGTFDTWLVPYVVPGDSAQIKDEDYPKQTATYFVEGVKTSISKEGGRRSITPGIKLY